MAQPPATTTGPPSEVDFDHVALSGMADPFPVLADLRSRCPVAHSTNHDGFWALFRYADVARAAQDPATFSSRDVTIPTEVLPAPPPPLMVDPPVHRDFRAPLLERFSAGAVRKVEPLVRRAATRLIDDFIERGSADLAAELCIPYPAHGAMHLLSLPEADVPRFQAWAVRIFQNQGDLSIPMELAQYFGPMYGELAGQDGDEIPSLARRLVIDGREIQLMEYVMLLTTLVVAALDTTANATSQILLVLAQQPELRSALIADPGLLPSAIEELLRYVTPLPALARVTTCPVELGGQVIGPDEKVLLNWIAANHDPDEFPDPDSIILDRSPNRHLAFGLGPHRCLGMHLARLEVRVLLEEVLSRLPDYRVDEPAVVRGAGITRMIHSLPASFTPGERRG